jgi:predicted nucleic acid-binding protein
VKPRIYVDTSVFGGYFDEEFAAFTRPFFDRVAAGDFTVVYSTVTLEELTQAPPKVRSLVSNLHAGNSKYVEPDEESVLLAESYIREGVVGATSFADCLHIALASIHTAEYLVSWNFKHIVNISRIRGYNAVNLKLGYRILEIRSPRDFGL